VSVLRNNTPALLAPRHPGIAGPPARKADHLTDLAKIPVTTRAAYLLEQAVKKSKRSSGIQLPLGFVRAATAGTTPPIATFIRGGRGGEVRLKLYLTLVLIGVRAPHMIKNVPASTWAEMLDLDKPTTLGARRVSDALQWLNNHNYIDLDSQRGRPPTVTLKSAIGDDKPFARGLGVYLGVPKGLWEHHWINRLSATGLALLLVLLDLQGGHKQSDPPSLPGAERRRYGISDDTWTRGRKELEDLGLLTVSRRPHGRTFDFTRMRNTYWVDKTVLDRPMRLLSTVTNRRNYTGRAAASASAASVAAVRSAPSWS
jgi:hypothetical protein